ncbi:DUF739 family protein [Clostridium saccharoperbutylacetonicum]|uniref:DUF739 family protein n=1 Tax=Clostridium saccharoperbutylacetonicum TaxID=36745 RepID=UPI0039E7F8FE
MNFNKLKGKMTEMEYTQEKLAVKLGITLQSLNSKINNRSQFNFGEIIKIINVLQINSNEIVEIFFKDNILNMQQRLGD